MGKILGVKIDSDDFAGVMQKIKNFLHENKLHQIATVNPEFIVSAQYDKEFKNILNKCDLCVADGFGLQLAAKFLGEKIGPRLTGVDLTWEIAKFSAENGYSIFLLGAKEGIAKEAAERIKFLYPNLKIAGTWAGSPQEEGLIERINQTKPDILLVSFGAPKQEKFIYNNKDKIKVKLAMGVGGTFDYLAEIVPYAPNWIRTLGLEWLYRLVTQPKRFKRIFNAIIKFPIIVFISKIFK